MLGLLRDDTLSGLGCQQVGVGVELRPGLPVSPLFIYHQSPPTTEKSMLNWITDHGVAICTGLYLPILHGMQEHPAYYQAQRKVHQPRIQTATFNTPTDLRTHTQTPLNHGQNERDNDDCNIH